MSSYFDNSDKIDEWLIRRRAKFTSSEQWKILPTSRQGSELWSKTAMTHIEAKAIELSTKYYTRPEIDEVEALRHGKAEEFPSFVRYVEETKNYSMAYLGDESPMFLPCPFLPDESGGTPDGIHMVGEGDNIKVDYGVELKNPVNPAYHFRRLAWKSMWDVKEGYPSCYAQIQDLIRITGAFGWDFVSHDDRQLMKSKQIKIIEIKPDQKFIDNLEIRIRLAVKEKYKILSSHYGVEIANRTQFDQLIKQ